MDLTHRTLRRPIPLLAPAPTEGPVVLVVTADPGLRDAISGALEREGYRVLTAAHAGHALLACMQAERVDLLVTEISMADMSGPALSASLRRRRPEMRTVYVASAGAAECEGVLVRPFTRDALLALAARATREPTERASAAS